MLSLLSTLVPIVDKLVDMIPNPAAREKAKLEMQGQLLNALVEESNNQAEINKAEAAHTSLWVAGWRPAIGWVCAAGFAWTFLFYPVLTWFAALVGLDANLPTIQNDMLFELTMGMLGLGALRSFDKWKGTAK